MKDLRISGTPVSLKVLNVSDIKPCDECKACCTVVGVKELKKSNYQQCQHECDSGCAIYSERPDSCREYLCGWKWGMIEGDERRRPDHLGVIFDFQPFPPPGAIRVWEVWPGAASSPRAQYLIRKLQDKYEQSVLVIDQQLGEACNIIELPDTYWKDAEQFHQEIEDKARADGLFDR